MTCITKANSDNESVLKLLQYTQNHVLYSLNKYVNYTVVYCGVVKINKKDTMISKEESQ
nr:MAG TPA: hypothetical protein [Caudoviricetes sp.]